MLLAQDYFYWKTFSNSIIITVILILRESTISVNYEVKVPVRLRVKSDLP